MTKKLTPKQRKNRQQNRWINAHYTAMTYRIKPETAAAFRETCADWGISQASVISSTMEKFTEARIKETLTNKLTEVTDSCGARFDITDNTETKKIWFAVLVSCDIPGASCGSFDFVEAVRKAEKEINRDEFNIKIGIFNPDGDQLGELTRDDILNHMTLIRELIAEG